MGIMDSLKCTSATNKKSPRNPEALSIPNGCGNLEDNSS